MNVTTVYLQEGLNPRPQLRSGMDKNKINRLLGILLLILLAGFVLVLLMQLFSLAYTPARSACTKQVCLKKFLDGPPAYNDEYMAKFLQSKYMRPASSGPLNLASYDLTSTDEAFVNTRSFTLDYFKGRSNGRFLVLGAGDGEYEDLTLALERDQGWTGLLIEPNPKLYELLVSKNRNAELCSACVSPFSYPSIAEFAYPTFDGEITEREKIMRFRETKLKQLWDSKYQLESFKHQCIPLVNMIYAAHTITDKIDLLVLDMAGSDLDILLSTNLDWLPEVEMVMITAHGSDIATEVGGYFMEKNMVVSKVFGEDANHARFIIMKFQADTSLID